MAETATRAPVEDLPKPSPDRKQKKRYIAERYEVVNTQEGGMGIVFLCRDPLPLI